MQNKLLWGLDLGGTKIEGIVLDPQNIKNPICRKRIATEGDKGYQHVLNQISTLIRKLSEEVGSSPQSVGLGTPGCLDPDTGLIRGSNSQHLNGKPLNTDLEEILQVPVRIANDANCFALAETRIGVVREIEPDANLVFGIIMGTGVGGGLVVNGQLVSGKHAIAGEWGHNFLHSSGGACFCGKTGCIETIISGPALERYHASISGEHQTLQTISRRSQQGDESAIRTIERLTKYFGLAISSVINLLDPDIIVIGGGVGNIDALYTEGSVQAARRIFSPTMRTRIVKPKLGDSAGVFGAASLTQPN